MPRRKPIRLKSPTYGRPNLRKPAPTAEEPLAFGPKNLIINAESNPYRAFPMAERSPYQDRIIRNYYQNQDAILVQRLGDLITDLYLAEGKQRARLWKRTAETLEKLKIPATRRQHLLQSDNPALLAKLLEELLAKQ